MVAKPPAISFHFGEFVCDPARRELRRGGERVELPLKVFDCLVFLIEHRDRAIGRGELIANVWGKADLSESVLNMAILSARRAVDDNGQDQNAIRTIKGFGYRWMRAVEERPDSVKAPSPTPAAPSPRFPFAAAVLLLALAGVASWSARVTQPVTVTATDTIAILPVRVDIDENDDVGSWMRLGLMDLIAERVRSTGSTVVPSDNIVALTRQEGDEPYDDERLARIRQATHAGRIFEARIARREGGWRIVIHERVGGDSIPVAEGEGDDVLVVAAGVADQLVAQVGPDTGPRDAFTATHQPDALDRLLHQIEGARLGDRIELALRLIDQADPNLRETPKVRLQQAWLHYQASRWDAAEAGFEGLHGELTPDREPALYGEALFGLSKVALRRSDFHSAESAATEALASLRASGDLARLGAALNQRGAVRALMFRPAGQVKADFAEARVALAAAGDRLGLARLDANLALAALTQDRLTDAVVHARLAADMLRRFGDVNAELRARLNIVRTSLSLLDTRSIREDAERMGDLMSQVADVQLRLNALLVLSHYHAENGQFALASSLLNEAFDGLPGLNDPSTTAYARRLRTDQLLLNARREEALLEARAIVDACARQDDCVRPIKAAMHLVRALLINGQDVEAAAVAKTMVEWAADSDRDWSGALAALAEAEVAVATGNIDGARAAYPVAMRGFVELGVPRAIRDAVVSYAGWLIDQGRPEEAVPLVEHIAPWTAGDYESQLLQLRLYRALGHRTAWRSALDNARLLAGDRTIPLPLQLDPAEEIRSASIH